MTDAEEKELLDLATNLGSQFIDVMGKFASKNGRKYKNPWVMQMIANALELAIISFMEHYKLDDETVESFLIQFAVHIKKQYKKVLATSPTVAVFEDGAKVPVNKINDTIN